MRRSSALCLVEVPLTPSSSKKPLYYALVDLEKAFVHMRRKILLWDLRSLGVEEWAVRVIQGMYSNAWSQVQVSVQYSGEFGVGVGVHQGSVLSPLLFILVLEALSREFKHWCTMVVPLRWWLGAHRGHPKGVYLQAQGVKGHGK